MRRLAKRRTVAEDPVVVGDIRLSVLEGREAVPLEPRNTQVIVTRSQQSTHARSFRHPIEML
jgi:hypothetical protein